MPPAALVILVIPLLLAALPLVVRRVRMLALLNVAGYGLLLAGAVALIADTGGVSRAAAVTGGFFYFDALSVFFIFVSSIVVFAASAYSVGYIARDLERGTITERKARLYYLLFDLFAFSIFLVPAVNNLGMLWAAIEMTTLISAFLVGFYMTKQAVEAAWKYIIICSAGIIFALLGTILFYYAFSHLIPARSLYWTDMIVAASRLDPKMIKIAFIFILVGYGTKAGLAPLHTWLPDAHSQAVAPVSALLSGVLLKTALYAILRFGVIVVRNGGFSYFSNLMLLFGVISLAVSCGFILVQKDLKRLLAYSSIEHIGIICVGFGFGPVLGYFGALWHIMNHAAAKSLIFFGAGNIVSTYRRHIMSTITGVMTTMPFTGVMVFAGVFALTGFPPFAVFFSEFTIILAGFMAGSYIAAGATLLLTAVIFAAMINHFGRMLFGAVPGQMRREGERLSGKVAFLFLLLQISVTGLLVPWLLKGQIAAVIDVLKGV